MNLTRASFYLTATNIGLAALTALNFFFLAIVLPPKQLGILSILLTLPSLGMNLLSLGYNKAAIYYVGRKTLALETVLANGVAICLVLGVLIGAGLLIAEQPLRNLFPDIPLNLLYLAIASTPTQIFMFYLTEACIAADLLAVNIITRVIPPITYVAGCITGILQGTISAKYAFILYLSGIVLADIAGLGIVIVRSTYRRLFTPNWKALQTCLGFGGKAQIGEIAHYLALRLDLVLVGVWVGMEASGYYSMAARLGETIWLAAHSVQSALSAKVAQDFQASIRDKGRRLARAVRYTATGSLLIALGIVGVSFVAFRFFLTQYEPAFPLLLAFAPGQIALAVFLLLVANLIGDGFPTLATRVRVLLFAVSLLFYLLLIPFWGALGAGLATSISYIASTILTAVILAKKYEIRLAGFLVWNEEDRAFIKASRQYLSRYFAV
ncbi:MAG TPA: oligosaccharide flippase family protein [Blastocatellia bacterium]|nr:oligosaccharide flippase family protein [Blastocatellia bacterium]